MLDIAQLLNKIIIVCESLELPYMVVGSVASMAFGEYRATNDIDVVIRLSPQEVSRFCQQFPESEYYVSEAAAQEAIRLERMFNVVELQSGLKVDFAIAQQTPWGKSELERRRKAPIVSGVVGFTASPEDIIIAKLKYFQEGESQKHLRDVAAMCQISGDLLDRNYLNHWIEQLNLGEPWKAIQTRLEN